MKALVLCSVSLLSLCLTEGPASAQSSDPAPAQGAPNGDIVVTAQRREQKLQDIPASISAIGSAQLAKTGAVSLSQVLVTTPSVQVNKPYGDGGPPDFVIRGISSTDSEQNSSKPIAIYLDEGIRNYQLFEAIPLFDVERVEVLRGPQGTLYGKNATGGAINIITKKPTFDTEGYLTVGGGNFNERTAQGAFQTPLIKDILSFRVAFTYTKNDGVFKNLTPGLGDLDQTDVFAARGTLLFQPSDKFDATLRLTHMHSGGRDTAPGAGAPGHPDFSTAYPLLAAIPGTFSQGLGFFENRTTDTPHRSIETNGVNLLINYHLSDAYTVTSVTTYDAGHWITQADNDGLPIDFNFANNTAKDARQFVQELRIASKLDGRFNWQAGAMFSYDHIYNSLYYLFYADPRCGPDCHFDLGVPSQDPNSVGFASNNSFSQTRYSYSGYLRATYEILDGVTLTGGVRQSHDELKVFNYEGAIGDRTDPRLIQTFSGIDRRQSFNNTSFEGGIDWKIKPHVLAYASYKQGYRTGAVNASAVNSVDEITIAKPEKAAAIEAGLKTSWLGGKVTANFAAFQTQYKDQQVQGTVTDPTTLAVLFPLLSIPKARIRGVEGELSVKPIPTVTLSANVSALDPKYTRGIVVNGADVTGNQIVGAAKFQTGLSGDAILFSNDDSKLDLNMNGTYTSKLYYDVNDSPSIAQHGYWLANSKLSLEHKNLTFSLYARNLFNQHYWVIGFVAVGADYHLRGNPRQFGGQISYRF